MTGTEVMHERGRSGLRHAKRWLEATTRVNVPWLVFERPERVRIKRPDGSEKDFDFAGYWAEGTEFATYEFFGECKNYANASDQPAHYKAYLADCYFHTLANPDALQHYMWVTWSPFSASKWSTLCTEEAIVEAVQGSDHAVVDGSRLAVDRDLARQVAERLWIFVLSHKQLAHLTLSVEMEQLVRTAEATKRAGMS